jgi:GNAT superfamily N-acetyltransferase
MSAEDSVRPARATDAAAIGTVQAEAWRAAYGDLLPADVLEQLTGEALAEQWRDAVVSPPSARHHVLVACAGHDVVGFVAMAPADDADLDGAVDAEVHALVVGAAVTRVGHGSRLLQAAADVLRADGFRTAHSWLLDRDVALRAFLLGAGWGLDGASRSLDLRGDGAVVVDQLRLHTALEDDAA